MRRLHHLINCLMLTFYKAHDIVHQGFKRLPEQILFLLKALSLISQFVLSSFLISYKLFALYQCTFSTRYEKDWWFTGPGQWNCCKKRVRRTVKKRWGRHTDTHPPHTHTHPCPKHTFCTVYAHICLSRRSDGTLTNNVPCCPTANKITHCVSLIYYYLN